MPIPDFQSTMRPFLANLADGQPHTITDLHNKICEDFKLTPDEIKKRINSGRQTVIRNRVGWARTYLYKAGLIDIPNKGEAQITERGEQALKECPERVDVKYLKRYPEFLEFVTPKQQDASVENNTEEVTEENTPEEQLSALVETLNKALADELLATVKATSPEFFEKLVVDLMLAMGYGNFHEEAGKVTSYTNDGGIDGTINVDKLGLETIYLQAKRYTNKTVGRPEVQAFSGALDMENAKKGVFITTSTFSNEAREFAERIAKKIVLIDGKKLVELMLQHNFGVTSKDVYTVKGVDSAYFSEDN